MKASNDINGLIKATEDNDSYVAHNAADALAKIGKPAVVQIIDTMRRNDVTMQFEYVFQTVGEIAVEPLTQAAIGANPYFRRKIAQALGNTGSFNAINPLIQMLKDNNEEVQSSACDALGSLSYSIIMLKRTKPLKKKSLKGYSR